MKYIINSHQELFITIWIASQSSDRGCAVILANPKVILVDSSKALNESSHLLPVWFRRGWAANKIPPYPPAHPPKKASEFQYNNKSNTDKDFLVFSLVAPTREPLLGTARVHTSSMVSVPYNDSRVAMRFRNSILDYWTHASKPLHILTHHYPSPSCAQFPRYNTFAYKILIVHHRLSIAQEQSPEIGISLMCTYRQHFPHVLLRG